jgi:hypothetical protein
MTTRGTGFMTTRGTGLITTVEPRVTAAFSPIALVKIPKANTVTLTHLFI